MPMPRLDEVAPVVVGEPGAAVDVAVDDPGPPQRRVEAVARVGEVGRRRRRPQPGVDPDEQQPQSGADEVRDRRVAERLQLGPREPHGPTGYGCACCSERRPAPGAGRRGSRAAAARPRARRTALSRTLLAGRGAGRGGSSSAVEIGRTSAGSCPRARTISTTNSYQVTAPWLVTWMIAERRSRARRRSTGARSAVNDGQPRWSSTNASAPACPARSAASRRTSVTMFDPSRRTPTTSARRRRRRRAPAPRAHRPASTRRTPTVARADPTRGTGRSSVPSNT